MCRLIVCSFITGVASASGLFLVDCLLCLSVYYTEELPLDEEFYNASVGQHVYQFVNGLCGLFLMIFAFKSKSLLGAWLILTAIFTAVALFFDVAFSYDYERYLAITYIFIEGFVLSAWFVIFRHIRNIKKASPPVEITNVMPAN